MSQIGKNIRKIRATKGLSQSAFANIFDITRASVGAYEEGRAEPKTDFILQMAKHFSIPLESLLTEELTVNKLTKFNVKAILDTNHAIKKKSIPYINNWNWDDFISGDPLPEDFTIDFPDNFINGDIAFEVTNQIQTDLENGTVLICKELNTPNSAGDYLIISKDDARVEHLKSVKSLKASYKRLFIINQKIVNLNSGSTNTLESRLAKLEKEIKALAKKEN